MLKLICKGQIKTKVTYLQKCMPETWSVMCPGPWYQAKGGGKRMEAQAHSVQQMQLHPAFTLRTLL